MKRLFRSEENQQIAGVCAGLAEYFSVDVTLIRIVFLILTLAGGPGLIIYIAMWWIMPTREKLDDVEYTKRKVDE